MTRAQIEAQIRPFVVERFMFGQGADTLANDASFLESGLIDSTGVLELIMFLEDRFGIRVADEEMLPENLDTVSAIATYVRRKNIAAA